MAWVTSIPFLMAGSFVAGHFFGDAVWQFVKHGSVNAYQAIKRKITG